MAKALLGIDVGGGSVRAVVREIESGKVTAVKHGMGKALFTIGEFGYGMDTGMILSITAGAVKDCLAKSGCAAGDILALSTSVLRHTLVALDKDGQVLFSSPNRDARAVDATMRLNDTCADEIYKLSGHRPMPNLTACKLLWLQETQPALYADIKTAFSLQDYLNYKFTGKIFAERSQAGETMLFDLAANAWSDAMIAKLGLDRSMFAELIDAGVSLGNLTSEAAQLLGLSEATVVVTGAGDTQSALLGMGAIENGGIAVAAGTTAPLQMVLDKPVVDAKGRLWTGVAGVPGKYVVESNAGGMGVSLEWIAGLLFNDNPNPCGALMAAAAKAGPGAGGMLSTVGAQIFNNSVLSLPIEQTLFSTTNYVPDAATDRNKAARAVVEGMAFALRGNIEQIEEVAGLKVGEIKLGGGMAKDGIFADVVSEAAGRPVAVSEFPDIASAMGAVICAAVGAGVCADYRAATEKFAGLKAPIAIQSDAYERIYDEWAEMYKSSADNFMQLGALITELRQDAAGADGGSDAEAVSLRIYADADLSEDAVKMLGEFGSITYKSYRDGEMLEGDDMIATLKDYDVFITEVDIVDAPIIKELPNLRMIGVCRGNPTNIDIDACSAAGIPVVYTPGRNCEAVADMTIAFMLNIARMVPESAAFLKEKGDAGDMGRQGAAYFRYQGLELWRANVGIVGGGAIGRKVIKRLLGFEANVFVYDPYLSNEDAILMGAKKVELDDLLAVSDIVSLHAPVTPETTNMIDAAAFGKMKDGVLVVNTARAALMDYSALLAGLKSGKVKGAALDVFPVEPPASDDPLVLLPNVLSTPHTAGNTKQVGVHQGLIMVENMHKLMAGELSTDVVNRKAFSAGFSFSGEKKIDAAALEQLQDNVVGVNDLHTKKDDTKAASAAPAAPVAVAAAPKAAPSGPYGQYMALIQEFLSNLAGNEEVKAKTSGKEISFQITFKDNEESCYIAFNKGMIDAGLGAYGDSGAEVNLRMPIEIFDGMMLGTINGANAAMTGKMSFTGNVRKAMSMQSILKLMMSSYQDAIAKVGAVDVKALAAAAGSAPAAAPAAAAAPPAATAAAPTKRSGGGAGYGKYMELIKEFLSIMSQDEQVKAKTSGKEISFQITFKDNEESCYLNFNKGQIDADLGAYPPGASVNLRMPIEIFDGMMMGTVNGAKAAMTGQMSFTGDVRKAMSMQSILNLMMNSYQAALAKVGPIDIAALGAAEEEPAAVEAAPAAAAAAPAATAPAEAPRQGFFGRLFGKQAPVQQVVQQPVIQQVVAAPKEDLGITGHPKTGDIRDELLQITTELFHKGLITGIGGNISVRCEDNPNHCWIMPSSIYKGDLAANQMVRIDLDGNTVGGATELSASSEKNVHTAIYKARPDISAVIHSHATKSTLMGLAGLKFAPVSSDAAFFGEVPVVPFMIPGTPELGDMVAEAMGEEKAVCIMQNHGLVVAGTSLRRASDMTDCVEITAAKILEAKAMGVELKEISGSDLEELTELGKMLV